MESVCEKIWKYNILNKRKEQIKELLQKNDLLCAPTEKITSDASNRKYQRLTKGNKTVILMDSNPEENEPVNNFIYFTNFLRKHNFSAPKIYDSDIPNGLLLLEDLGARNFADILKVTPKVETNIYKEAVNQLIMIQSKGTPKQAKPYSTEILVEEALLFTEWYLGEVNCSRLSTQSFIIDWISFFVAVLTFFDLLKILVLFFIKFEMYWAIIIKLWDRFKDLNSKLVGICNV